MGPSKGYPGTVKQAVAGSYHRALITPKSPGISRRAAQVLPSKGAPEAQAPPRTSLAPSQSCYSIPKLKGVRTCCQCQPRAKGFNGRACEAPPGPAAAGPRGSTYPHPRPHPAPLSLRIIRHFLVLQTSLGSSLPQGSALPLIPPAGGPGPIPQLQAQGCRGAPANPSARLTCSPQARLRCAQASRWALGGPGFGPNSCRRLPLFPLQDREAQAWSAGPEAPSRPRPQGSRVPAVRQLGWRARRGSLSRAHACGLSCPNPRPEPPSWLVGFWEL